MKNIVYGISTIAFLTGLTYVLISPGFTDVFIGDEPYAEQELPQDKAPASFNPVNPEQLLQQTGEEWTVLSDMQKLEFTVHILNAMESREISVSKGPSEFIKEIDAYYKTGKKELTIEKVIMKILAENWRTADGTE